MSKQLIIANWKSNGKNEEISIWCNHFVKNFSPYEERRFCICPPYIYTGQFHSQLIAAAPPNFPLSLGAQNISAYPQGAYTGEISGSMLRDNNCEYVLIGHSERRVLLNESAKDFAQKMKQAIDADLKIVFCVGENHNEYKTRQSSSIIKKQLRPVSDLLKKELCYNLVIAYEPVWAIGTGLAAKPDYADKMHSIIREELARYRQCTLRVVYGGSINMGKCLQFSCYAEY